MGSIRPQYPKGAGIVPLEVPGGGLCSRTKSVRTHGEALSRSVATKVEENPAYHCLALRYCAQSWRGGEATGEGVDAEVYS